MNSRNKQPPTQQVKDVTEQLQALMGMTVVELRAQYLEVFGMACPSRNKDYLRKKIAYRIQELAEGGLSERARARINELAEGIPLRQRRSRKQGAPTTTPSPAAPVPAVTVPAATRDPRLPPAGTLLRREHGGAAHEVKVLADGFEYQGLRYASLSKVAKAIAGTHWNGFAFFATALAAAGASARSGEAK